MKYLIILLFLFAEYLDSATAPIDTVGFSMRAVTDTVFVTRTGATASPDYKSGGRYSYIGTK